MKKRCLAYVYVPVLACMLAIGGMFVWSQKAVGKNPAGEQIYNLDEYFETEAAKPAKTQPVDEKNVVLENTAETVPEAAPEFMLRALDDYVVVYRNGLKESYMTTGIAIKELPEETQNEIIEGKEIADEEALYFFLESHSS